MKGLSGVYIPAEDTFFLEDVVKDYFGNSVLEIGVGSGYLTTRLMKNYKFVVGTDLSLKAIKDVKSRIRSYDFNDKVDLICCNGATVFQENVFNLAVFNPPYLPSEGFIDTAVDGGEGGIKIVGEWLNQTSKIIIEGGVIIFIISSLSDYRRLFKEIKPKLNVELVRRKKLFFEELMVLKAYKSG